MNEISRKRLEIIAWRVKQQDGVSDVVFFRDDLGVRASVFIVPSNDVLDIYVGCLSEDNQIPPVEECIYFAVDYEDGVGLKLRDPMLGEGVILLSNLDYRSLHCWSFVLKVVSVLVEDIQRVIRVGV